MAANVIGLKGMFDFHASPLFDPELATREGLRKSFLVHKTVYDESGKDSVCVLCAQPQFAKLLPHLVM
jgi:hypothetical protein